MNSHDKSSGVPCLTISILFDVSEPHRIRVNVVIQRLIRLHDPSVIQFSILFLVRLAVLVVSEVVGSLAYPTERSLASFCVCERRS